MMRVIAPALGGLAVLLAAGCAQQPDPAGQASARNDVCLPTTMIDHTEVPDDSTILFYMRDGKIWKNSLPFNCPGLKYQSGFEFEASFDEVCANAQAIHVLRQNTICTLGDFTPFAPPKPAQ